MNVLGSMVALLLVAGQQPGVDEVVAACNLDESELRDECRSVDAIRAEYEEELRQCTEARIDSDRCIRRFADDRQYCIDAARAQREEDEKACREVEPLAVVFKDGGFSWYATPIVQKAHVEHGSVAQAAYGQEVLCLPVKQGGKSGFRCTLAPSQAAMEPIGAKAEELFAAEAKKPPSRQRSDTEIFGLAQRAAGGEPCPPGMRLESDPSGTLCSRFYPVQGFCARGTLTASELVAGCGSNTCPSGKDLDGPSGGRLSGCAECARGGALDLGETRRWMSKEGVGDAVLCKVSSQTISASARQQAAAVKKQRSSEAARIAGALEAAVRGLPSADGQSKVEQVGTRWPAVFVVEWRVGSVEQAEREARLLASEAKKIGSTMVRFRVLGVSGSPLFLADWYKVDGFLRNVHRGQFAIAR